MAPGVQHNQQVYPPLRANPGDHTLGQAVNNYFRSARGLFRLGQFFDKAPKALNDYLQYFGQSRVEALDTLHERSFTMWTSFVLTGTRTWEMKDGVFESVKKAQDAFQTPGLTNGQVQYRVKNAFGEVAGFAAMSAHSMGCITTLFRNTTQLNKGIFSFAEVLFFGQDVISLDLKAENLVVAAGIDLVGVPPEMADTVEQTKICNMLEVIKDVISVATGFFGLLLATTGVSVLSGIALTTLGVLTAVLAISKDLYSETMPYKTINFLDI